MKKNLQILVLLIVVAGGVLFELNQSTSSESETKDSFVSYSNEERPDLTISKEEKDVNERSFERQRKSKTSLKAGSEYSSYADGQIQGTWDQIRFLAPDKHSYGFRVDGSVYDREHDIIYAISYAGHIWKINREPEDFTKTRWELINHKGNYKRSYIEGLNKPDGSFRMIRSSKTGMQYSDDEGRTWISASGVTAVEETFEGAIANIAGTNRIFTILKTNSSNLQVFVSNDNGESYNSLSIAFSPSGYKVKMFKVHNSESVFIAAFSLQDKKISLYECAPDNSDFSLVNTSSTTFVGVDRVFGTYFNDTFHFYVAAKNSHIYYTGDKGTSWQLTNSNNNSSGDTNPRTVHPTKPNIIFKGYLDVEKSSDYGSSFTNFSHLMGWDVWEMTMYQRKDLSFFHFVGMDFGCYISDTPEIPAEYVQLNNTAPIQMCYDADHSQNFNSSFSSTQDRGTVGYENFTNEVLTTDVKTTDGLRVTLGNRESSVWTWMYYGSIFRKANFAAGNSGLSQINWTSNWWAAPMIPSPNKNEDAVYVPAGSSLTKFTYNSHDNQIIKTNHYFNFLAETGSKISGFGYSPINPNKWYVSVENGKFLYSVDGGQSFNETTYTGSLPRANDQGYNYPKNQHIIKGSKLNEDRVYYAGVGNVFLISNDGGKTFTNHSDGLDVYRIRDFDLTSDEKFIFAACAYGGIWVFSFEDDHWYPINDGPVPFVDFTDVEFMVKENTVNFASYGNGILKFRLDGQNSSIAFPDNLTVEVGNSNQVILNWQDKSENEDGFIIERLFNEEFQLVGSVGLNQSSFIDYDLQAPGNYFYRIKAFNSTDESYYSNYAVAKIKSEGEVSKSKWTLISVDSEDTYGAGNPAVSAIDDNPGSFWFTQWSGGQPPHPHEIVIDMHETLNFIGFSYLPRQDGKTNGMIKDYEFYISSDNVTWTKVASGAWESSADLKEVYFSATQEARYIKLAGLSCVNGTNFTSCAEVSVLTKRLEPKAPNAPQFVQGGRLSETELELIWMDKSDDEQGFVLEQYMDGEFVEILTVNPNVTSCNLKNVKEDESYLFRIASFNDVGHSTYSDTLTILALGESSVGINDVEVYNIIVYPNPFSNELNLELGSSGHWNHWQIIDMSGNIVMKGVISKSEDLKTINVQSLKTGVYVIQVGGQNRRFSKTILKH